LTGASLPHRCRRRCGRAMALRVRLDPRRVRLTSYPTCCGRARRRSMRGEAIGRDRRQGIAAAGKEKGRGKRRGRAGFGPASAPSTAIYRGRWGPYGCTRNGDVGCWPMRGLFCAKKCPRPANRVGRCDTGWDGGSARVSLSPTAPASTMIINRYSIQTSIYKSK
jgi:hypothetical protein